MGLSLEFFWDLMKMVEPCRLECVKHLQMLHCPVAVFEAAAAGLTFLAFSLMHGGELISAASKYLKNGEMSRWGRVAVRVFDGNSRGFLLLKQGSALAMVAVCFLKAEYTFLIAYAAAFVCTLPGCSYVLPRSWVKFLVGKSWRVIAVPLALWPLAIVFRGESSFVESLVWVASLHGALLVPAYYGGLKLGIFKEYEYSYLALFNVSGAYLSFGALMSSPAIYSIAGLEIGATFVHVICWVVEKRWIISSGAVKVDLLSKEIKDASLTIKNLLDQKEALAKEIEALRAKVADLAVERRAVKEEVKEEGAT